MLCLQLFTHAEKLGALNLYQRSGNAPSVNGYGPGVRGAAGTRSPSATGLPVSRGQASA